MTTRWSTVSPPTEVRQATARVAGSGACPCNRRPSSAGAEGETRVETAVLVRILLAPQLDLEDTPITDAGLEHVKGLTRLRALSLRGTRVTGLGLQHLKGMANLRDLDLADTPMTDQGLAHLHGLTNLESLCLLSLRIRSQITDAGINALHRALPQVHIRLDPI
jgi:Leucine Rich repeat